MDTSSNKNKEEKDEIGTFIQVSKSFAYKNNWNNLFFSFDESSKDFSLTQKLTEILEYFQSNSTEDVKAEEGMNITCYEINKLTAFYKLGDFINLMKTFKEIIQENPQISKISLFYIYALFILIEMSIKTNQSNLSFKLIKKLYEYLSQFKSNPSEENSSFNKQFFLQQRTQSYIYYVLQI